MSSVIDFSCGQLSAGCENGAFLATSKNPSHCHTNPPLSLSCGELSAGSESKEEDESFYSKRKSQLNVIFNVLGTPSEAELRHLDSKSARDIRALHRIPASVNYLCSFSQLYIYPSIEFVRLSTSSPC